MINHGIAPEDYTKNYHTEINSYEQDFINSLSKLNPQINRLAYRANKAMEEYYSIYCDASPKWQETHEGRATLEQIHNADNAIESLKSAIDFIKLAVQPTNEG